MSRVAATVLGVAALLAGGALRAQQGTFETKGKVVDGAGKGVPGVKVTLTNTKRANLAYSQTTDKRGDFWFSDLLYDEAARQWRVTAEKEGYVPVKVRVEIRTQNDTLANEVDTKLGREKPSVEFQTRGFGKIKVNFTLQPAEEVPELAATEGAAPVLDIAAPAQAAPTDPYAEGVERARQRDLQGAVDLLQKAIEVAPEDPERRETLAKVLSMLGRGEEAAAQAAKAAELAPNRASAHLLVGQMYADKGDYASAAEAFGKAKELEPENVRVLEGLAKVADETGKTDEAIAANEAIVKLAPGNVEAWMSLGDLYHRKKRPDKAEEAHKKVVELDPANAYKTFLNLGALIENRPNLTEADKRRAIEAFRKAIEIKPDYAVAHRHLAYALLRAGDLEGAKKELETYLTLAPDARDAAEIRKDLADLGGQPPPPTKKR